MANNDIFTYKEDQSLFGRDFIEEDISLMTDNIAETLDETTLRSLGSSLVEAFDQDKLSRGNWEKENEQWLELAAQIIKPKNEPWERASNVKYPLLTTAAIQFHARAMPALLNNNQPVLQGIIGKDPTGEKRKRANRVSTYMSYQVTVEMDTWIDELDRLLFILPVAGTVFKKTYYDQLKESIVSEVILPQDLVINYYATEFEHARKTHIIPMSYNSIREFQLAEIFLDISLTKAGTDPFPRSREVRDELHGLSPLSPDEDITHTLLEMQERIDLDGDGYKEPYIITIDYDSKKILRIIANWSTKNYKTNADNKVIRIVPNEYFTSFIYLPSTESKIYGVGMGNLLGPLNEAINTTTNQLIDAGTLATLQGGFLGRGIRFKGGKIKFKPGMWQSLPSSGEDIHKNIFPLPVKEPSMVLYQLLGLLINSGEKLSSVNSLLTGENPGQNQPYSTTMAVLEQGLKVYAGIYTRIHRALSKEYKKIYNLNGLYLDEPHYLDVIDVDPSEGASVADFTDSRANIRVASDPNMITEAQKLIKAESLVQKMLQGLVPNQQEVVRRVLEAEGHEDIDVLMQAPPPQPDFKTKLEMDKFAWQQIVDKFEMQLDSIRIQYEAMKDQADTILKLAGAEAAEAGTQLQQYQAFADQMKAREDAINQRIQQVMTMAEQVNKMKSSEGPEETAEGEPAGGPEESPEQ